MTTKVGNGDHGFDNTLLAFDESLKKLQLDYVDLYLIHWPVKGQRKETWRALERLLDEKRVRAIGVANYLVPFLEEMDDYANVLPALNQVESTPWLFQQSLMQYCKERNIQLQSYSPITRAQKFDDPRLQELCSKYEKTPAQIILQWNIAHGISTIPKSSNKKRLQENFDSLLYTLEKEDINKMDGFNENFRVCDDPMTMW